MKRTILASLAALALCACAPALPTSLPSAPVAVAARTIADERLASGLELGYQAWVYAIELGLDAGFFKGERAKKIAALDRQVYAALQVARSAYRTANAADYLIAYSEAKATLARAIASAKGLK